MAKYITTSKNPIFKEGIKFESESHSYITIFQEDIEISHLLKHGYIKEVQDPEFTKDDMVSFARWYSNHGTFEESGIEILNIWLKQRDK